MLEFSSNYVRGLQEAIVERKYLPAIISRASDELKLLLTTPSANAWWQVAPLGELTDTLSALYGPDSVKTIATDASKSRMGPISRPLLNVLLTVTGAKVPTLFSRAGTFVSIGVRPVTTTWALTSPKTGSITFGFKQPVPNSISLLWWGFMREAFSLVKTGRVAREMIQPDQHRFDIEWD